MVSKRTSSAGRKKGKSSLPAPGKRVRKVVPCSAPRPGMSCPRCKKDRLDYNGLLQLACPACGYVADAGGFT